MELLLKIFLGEHMKFGITLDREEESKHDKLAGLLDHELFQDGINLRHLSLRLHEVAV